MRGLAAVFHAQASLRRRDYPDRRGRTLVPARLKVLEKVGKGLEDLECPLAMLAGRVSLSYHSEAVRDVFSAFALGALHIPAATKARVRRHGGGKDRRSLKRPTILDDKTGFETKPLLRSGFLPTRGLPPAACFR